jgi:Uma2 family endonuclease
MVAVKMSMVATSQPQTLTAADFERIVALSENRERRLELIDGEMVEMVSSGIASRVSMRLGGLLDAHVVADELGFVTDAQGGYQIGADRLIPDVAFVSKAKRAARTDEAYQTVVPDLLVEVKSPTDSHRALIGKAHRYLDAGVTMVWLVLPENRLIEVIMPDEIATLRDSDTLTGGATATGFAAPVSSIFAGLA